MLRLSVSVVELTLVVFGAVKQWTRPTSRQNCSYATHVQQPCLRLLLVPLTATCMAAAGCRINVATAAGWPPTSAGQLNSVRRPVNTVLVSRSTLDSPFTVCVHAVLCRDKCHFCASCHSRFTELCVPLVGLNRLRVWQYDQCTSLRQCVKDVAALSQGVSDIDRELIAATYRSSAVLSSAQHTITPQSVQSCSSEADCAAPLHPSVDVLCCVMAE